MFQLGPPTAGRGRERGLARRRLPASPREAFATIQRRDTNVVCVSRPLEAVLRARLIEVARQTPFRRDARLDTLAPDATELLASIGDEAVRSFLGADIARLARWFGAVLGRRHLQATLSVLRSDGCRKIHTDRVTVRLLCTYAGPGTEWLPNRDFVRRHLGRTDVGLDAANRFMTRRGASLRRCEPGDALLLKGEAYPGNEGKGAAHRSPPIEASGEARLLLKIDEHPCGC